jgi:hypothetical protein
MRHLKRRIGLGVLLLAGGAQMLPAGRSNPPVRSEPDVPAEVAVILRTACYDCHSHRTRWPWYSKVAPVSWWLVRHVDKGREHLNFSDWPVIDFEAQDMARHEIEEEVSQGKMPLRSYKLLHPEARLDPAERQQLLEWARGGAPED